MPQTRKSFCAARFFVCAFVLRITHNLAFRFLKVFLSFSFSLPCGFWSPYGRFLNGLIAFNWFFGWGRFALRGVVSCRLCSFSSCLRVFLLVFVPCVVRFFASFVASVCAFGGLFFLSFSCVFVLFSFFLFVFSFFLP